MYEIPIELTDEEIEWLREQKGKNKGKLFAGIVNKMMEQLPEPPPSLAARLYEHWGAGTNLNVGDWQNTIDAFDLAQVVPLNDSVRDWVNETRRSAKWGKRQRPDRDVAYHLMLIYGKDAFTEGGDDEQGGD